MREPEGDLIPREIAERRGMTYRLNAKGFVCEAKDESPLLIDRLFNHNLLNQDHHFHGSRMIAMRNLLNRDVRCSVGSIKERLDNDKALDPEIIVMEDMDYLHVLREIHNPHWKRIVMVVCHDEAHERDCRFVRVSPDNHFHMAFDRLVDAMKLVNERKKAIRDAINACNDGNSMRQ